MRWRSCAGLALSLLAAGAVHADPPPGTDLSSPRHLWFERQHSVGGAWCCNVADGHTIPDRDWRQDPDRNRYQVRIGGEWRDVPEDALRDPAGGPNITGSAIVWYGANESGLRIYCFAPGYEY